MSSAACAANASCIKQFLERRDGFCSDSYRPVAIVKQQAMLMLILIVMFFPPNFNFNVDSPGMLSDEQR